MKKIYAVITILALALSVAGLSQVAFADKNTPPDERIPENPSGEGSSQGEDDSARAAREKKEAEEKAAREAKEAAARRARERAAAEAKKKEDARRAEEARRAEAEAQRAASEDMTNRIMQTGIEYLSQGRYQMALNVFRGYTGNNPHSADAWYWIARAHHALGDYDRAQAAVNIALEIDPYYGPLTKTPSGLEPIPPLTKQQKKEPRPSMSVLPVKPPLPSGLALEPVTISFPYLVSGSASGDVSVSGDAVSSAHLRYEPYPPMPSGRTARWMQANEKFNEIGRWRFRVDRMGIMTEPRVPVAWKGKRPYEVYFWTGKEWARIPRQNPMEPFGSILRRVRDDITEVVAAEGLAWNESDTPALAASASLMRYIWVGDVDLAAVSDDEREENEKK